MKVRVGWSGEHEGEWFRHDVELEENDFFAYAAEYGFDPEKISPRMKFAFLENEAMLLSVAWVIRHMPIYKDSAQGTVEEFVDRRVHLLETIGKEPA